MKQIEVHIPGFTSNTKPTTKDAICVFGKPNSGTTRFGLTMPHDEGVIGYLALDPNCKVTVEALKHEMGLDGRVVVNDKPFLADNKAAEIAMMPDGITPADKTNVEAKMIGIYREVIDRVYEAANKLVLSEAVQSVVIDKNSQLYNWILFSRHGRAQQIEQKSRGVPNQDMIDIINMVRAKKNLLLIHRAAEVYVKTGEKDSRGRDITAASGNSKPEAMGNIEGFVTATIELISNKYTALWDRTSGESDEEYEDRVLRMKYRCKVHSWKNRTLLEGKDLWKLPADIESKLMVEADNYEGPGIAGKDIRWDNVITAMGLQQ